MSNRDYRSDRNYNHPYSRNSRDRNNSRKKRVSPSPEWSKPRHNLNFVEAQQKIEELKQKIKSEFIVENQQIDIPKDKLSTLIGPEENELLTKALSELISSENLEFPHKKYWLKNIDEKFDNLTKYKCDIKYSEEPYEIPVLKSLTDKMKPYLYEGKYTTLPSEISEYDDMNILSDFFQEPARVRSMAGFSNQTVLSHWRDQKKNILWLKNLVEKRGDINCYSLREELYALTKGMEPSTFKATVAKTTIEMLNGKRVLDFCAGWGDRLLGALACQSFLDLYIGVDPNSDLFEGYNAMIERFAPEKKNNYKMICEPFEEADLGDQKFNLIFTGPPYFDYELYGTSKKQSVEKFPDLISWTVDFLFFCVKKAWNLLEDGGKLAININDVRSLVAKGKFYTEALHLMIISQLPKARYDGVVCFTGAQYALPRPIWIYTKDPTISFPSAASQECDKELAKYYSHYHKKVKENARMEKFQASSTPDN